MRPSRKFSPAFALLLLLAGCTSQFTNLTPRHQDRNANGLYPIEVIWENPMHALRHESVRPRVLVGFEAFPMERAAMLSNRWETLLPVGAGTNVVNYRVKVDYEYFDIPVVRSNSSLSPSYQLQILDK